MVEPISHFFYSHRLKLQFWDYGSEGKPALILVHGNRDHARNWDWVARDLQSDFHVYALDLRGHGNSAWAPGALYSISEHVLDLAVFADIVNQYPVYLIAHSMGAIISLFYSGTYPDRVKKLVAIEGVGVGPLLEPQPPAHERMKSWIGKVRELAHRESHGYPDLASAVRRMKEANPFLSDAMAEHLTLHGTNWSADRSLVWKFDQYVRVIYPFGLTDDDVAEFLGSITCPTLLFWGRQSFARDPEDDPHAAAIRNRKIVKVDQAGHWVHHDQLALFLRETREFLNG